jgi:hypothetical protein
VGDFRITVEGVGNHGCGRQAKSGEVVERCGVPNCVDCLALEFVKKLMETGAAMVKCDDGMVARLEHWPIRDVNGRRKRDNSAVGPVDDLIDGTRRGSFEVSGPSGCLTEKEE